jgi:hypothetical protein
MNSSGGASDRSSTLGEVTMHRGVGSCSSKVAAPSATVPCKTLVKCSGKIAVLQRLKEFFGSKFFSLGNGHEPVVELGEVKIQFVPHRLFRGGVSDYFLVPNRINGKMKIINDSLPKEDRNINCC